MQDRRKWELIVQRPLHGGHSSGQGSSVQEHRLQAAQEQSLRPLAFELVFEEWRAVLRPER